MPMQSPAKFSTLVFSVYILVEFYVLGGGVVNSLVGYRTWRAVGPDEFPVFHQIDSSLIVPLFVIFFFFSFIPQVLLFWYRPAVIPKMLVWAALLVNLIPLFSTLAIQIPIQVKLDQAFSSELIEELIRTDMMYRRIPMFILGVINFVMLFRVVSASVPSQRG